MTQRRIHAEGSYAHYVTFSCYKRRRLLQSDRCKRIVLGVLANELFHQKGQCVGFVLMPDHVHALLWFPNENQISAFMDKWKERSSKQIGTTIRGEFPAYAQKITASDPVGQARYYDFNIYSESKIREKLNYMHNNPVRAGLVSDILDWPWSSAAGWHLGKSVGVPLNWPP